MLALEISWLSIVGLVALVVATWLAAAAWCRRRLERDIRRQALRAIVGAASVPTYMAMAQQGTTAVSIALVCWTIVATFGFKCLFPHSATERSVRPRPRTRADPPKRAERGWRRLRS